MSARNIAYKVLFDIEKNKKYSNISLDYYLKGSDLDDLQRGFATELVYGVLENRIFLDGIINRHSKIKVKKMQYSVKISLRMGAYQLIFLDGVKDYAAINETVSMMKKIDKRSSNFVNAVLRNISRNIDDVFEYDENSIEGLATRYSFEKWIVERLVKENGIEKTRDILISLSEKPKIYLRVNRLRSSEFPSFDDYVDFVLERLSKDGIVGRKVEGMAEAIEVDSFKRIEKNELFTKGYISVQDKSSMLVGNVLNPSENSMVLDLCSAPGGKSTHLAEIMNNTGKIVAHDVFEHKIKLVKSYCERLGINNVEISFGDASEFNPEYEGKFDYVLCDVPCSGMGIVRRKPEIKYKKEEDVVGLPILQLQILSNAARYLKKGGSIVYSTCTIFDSENIDVVRKFLNENKGFIFESIGGDTFTKLFDEERRSKGYLKIMPNKDNMDGFFICKLKKV